MAGFEYQKVRSAAKKVLPRGNQLNRLVLNTMQVVSSVVGDTLGPGGRPVIIERHEQGIPPTVTKDGVTVFRSLGFEGDEHVIMEAARDCSVRTAQEAGDGTTTSAVLAEALVRYTTNFCQRNPRVSPQKVVERLRHAQQEIIAPAIEKFSVKVDFASDEGQRLLHAVAKISGNGDTELADAVMTCYREVGDDGNVTIVEVPGHTSKYEVERLNGYPVGVGYEQCCGKFTPEFINDQGAQRCWMPEPAFIVYNGKIHDMQAMIPLLRKVGEAWFEGGFNHNVVVVANDFSENVIAHFALNFKAENGLNIFPLKAPITPSPTGQIDFLLDVCAVTGATLFDPLTKPFDAGELADLGPLFEDDEGKYKVRGVEAFEATRFRSNIMGRSKEQEVAGEDPLEQGTLQRIAQVREQLSNAGSELDAIMLKERLAKLAGGIARLRVVGSSNGETKERRDRAEDAVMAVRGAIKHGCLPAGGWTLLQLQKLIGEYNDPILNGVLVPALEEPVRRLLANAGLVEDEESGHTEISDVVKAIRDGHLPKDARQLNFAFVNETKAEPKVYDAANHAFVGAYTSGLLDSTPAVSEAIRNSISIATLLGTLGGLVVFRRDRELERSEASATEQYLRDANNNPADERP